MALRGQTMPPAGSLGSDVGSRVVPRVDRVGPSASSEAPARGHADGRLAVRAREASTLPSKRMGGLSAHDRVAVAAEEAPRVLVGQYDEDVAGSGHLRRVRAALSARGLGGGGFALRAPPDAGDHRGGVAVQDLLARRLANLRFG